MAVAVSTGGCVVSWLWTFTLPSFLFGGFFFFNYGRGILRMMPSVLYTVYIVWVFFRALNVSQDSSEDINGHTVDTHMEKYAYSVYRHACRHMYTHKV